MPRTFEQRRRQTGQTLVIFALAISALFAFAGLAFDVGRFYSERRFLQNAADAAALAGVNSLIRGETDAQARAAAVASLTTNFARSPSGRTPPTPPAAGSEVYEPGFAGVSNRLIEGILINGNIVRVAIKNSVNYTFGRAVGLTDNVLYVRAMARGQMDLLPIAARRYINQPGPTGGAASPCTGLQPFNFVDFTATGNTACLGSDSDAALRTPASAGPNYPTYDPTYHGPIYQLLGIGAAPSNGADFRGFVALDVRNFETTVSRKYYNGVTSGTSESTLASIQANWLRNGYPGPDFPVSTVPVDYGSQVGLLSGNTTGIIIDAFDDRYRLGDEIMLMVYSGAVSAIPDFTIIPPSDIAIGTTQIRPVVGTYAVSRNAAFSGTVTMSFDPDTGNPNDPITTGKIVPPPVIHDPNPVTPTQGGGATVTMRNMSTVLATTGVYTIWLHGHSASPYLRDHYEPVSVNIGNVTRLFTVTTSSKDATAANIGNPVSWTVNVSTSPSGASNFNGPVTLSLEQLPAGIGSVSWSGSNPVVLGGGSSASQTRVVTVNTGTTVPGDYPIVLRATGTNSAGQPVTRLLQLGLKIAVATPSENYVDVLGFAVFRVAAMDSNTIWGHAITGMAQDPRDPSLRRGQVARLVPWS